MKQNQLLTLAIAISTVTAVALATVPMITANAHTGQIDNVCKFLDTTTVECTVEPAVGQNVLIRFVDGSEPIHKTVLFVDTVNKLVALSCGHFRDGSPIVCPPENVFQYTVVGNR